MTLDILIMDDHPLHSRILMDIVRDAGYNADVVYNAEDAWKALMKNTYDLLLTDIVVFMRGKPQDHGKGGLTLISRIRYATQKSEKFEQLKKMPIIAVSGSYEGSRTVNRLHLADTLGADATLSKPVDAEELINTIKKLTYSD